MSEETRDYDDWEETDTKEEGDSADEFDFGDMQVPLGDIENKTYADIVFVIDVTASMQPCIDKVKKMATGLYDNLLEGMKKFDKEFEQVRVRVIAFRDYYCDGKYAMQESDFFYLPGDTDIFREYVSSLEAKGGGDVPENALEALALAMKTDWVKEGQSKRHIIVLFTDAPAHPLEKNAGKKPELYPVDMFSSYGELLDAWNAGQGCCGDDRSGFWMDTRAERLVLFTPDEEGWNELGNECKNTIKVEINPNEGGQEIQEQMIINLLCKSAN